MTGSIPTFLISAPGGSEWILIIIAVLVLFGGKKIPEFMRGIGKGMREFNDAKNNVKKEFEDGMNEPPAPPRTTATTTTTTPVTTTTPSVPNNNPGVNN